MTELGQLEERIQEFAKRKVRIVAVTLEDKGDAEATQKQFPHLTVVSDPEQKLADPLQAVQRGANPYGGDTAAPTTLLIDGGGAIRWTFRPERYIVRLSPEELLAAVDQHLGKK
jgi:peroxiredoxin